MTIEGPNHWWQNWSKTHAYIAEKMFFPSNVAEIGVAIRNAEAARRPLRAVGGGWSFSDAAVPGPVSTNRPNVYAVEALAEAVPRAESFPDKSQASIATIADMSFVADARDSLSILDERFDPPVIYKDGAGFPYFRYLGGGNWIGSDGRKWGGPGSNFMNWLVSGGLRPIRAIPEGACIDEADSAGSLLMVNLDAPSPMPLPGWFYNGHGIWSDGLPDGMDPGWGTFYEITRGVVFPGFRFWPVAATPGGSLSLLLSHKDNAPAQPEQVYVINTRSLVSSLQQNLPNIRSAGANDATSSTPSPTPAF